MSGHEQARAVLEAMRDELHERSTRIDAHKQEKPEPDFAEQATQREDDDVVHALGEASRDRLAQIARALARIDANEYGLCQTCGEDIDGRRLEALPYTDQCIRCAEKQEATR